MRSAAAATKPASAGTRARNEVRREDCVAMGRFCLSATLRRTERLVTRHYDEYLAPTGITAVQLPILAAIALLEEPSFRALAEMLELDRSTLSRNLAVLEQRDLLSVGPSSGPKPGTIALTPAGRKTLYRAHKFWREAQADLEKIMSRSALRGGLSFLQRLRGALRQD
jgi:DNA-binding MarR family transcriptional regulator